MTRELFLSLGLLLAATALAGPEDDDGHVTDTEVRAVAQREAGGVRARGLMITPEDGGPVAARVTVYEVIGAQHTPVAWDHVFNAGDGVRIEITANQEGYAWIFSSEEGGASELSWPPEGKLAPVSPGSPLRLPSGKNVFRMQSASEERISVFVSKEPLSDPKAFGSLVDMSLRSVTRAAPRSVGVSGAGEVTLENIEEIFGQVLIRGDVYAKGDNPDDPSLYFASATGDGAGAMLHFTLKTR